MKNQTPNIIGAVFTCIVAGAAGCCGVAVSTAAIGLVGNVSGNLAASSLDPLFQRLMHSLCHRDTLPEARPLVAALRQSSHQAVDNLKILLRQKLESEYSRALTVSEGIVKHRMKQAETFFAALHKAVDASFDGRSLTESEADERLFANPQLALDDLRLGLRLAFNDPAANTQPLEDFFVEKFPAELERCFTHALAGDTLARAAFQQFTLNALRQDTAALLGGQAELKARLEELLGTKQFLPQFQLVLTERHNVLVNKMDEAERTILDVKTIVIEIHEVVVEGLAVGKETLEEIRSLGKRPTAPPPPELNYIPYLQDLEKEAIGRADDVDELHRLLGDSKLVAVVRGIGGMGKTTLARAYVTKYKEGYDHLVWLTNADNLVASCAAANILHQRLGLRFTDEQEEERFLRTMDALHAIPGNNLLVLDNAAGNLAAQLVSGKPLHQYLPGTNWKKLATSRERIARFKEFELQKLPHDAALALFEEHYGQADEAELTKLFETVDYHTLTIEVMAKTLYKSKGKLTISHFQDSLGRRKFDGKELQRRIEVDHQGSDAGIYMHLLDTFAEAGVAPGTIAYRVLQHFLLLPPEGLTEGLGHPFSFLEETLVPHAAPDAPALSDTIDFLCDLGWLTAEQDYHFSLHRLLRDVLLYKMKPEAEKVEGFIWQIAGLFDFDTGTNFSKLLPRLPYGDAILEVLGDEVNEAIARLQSNFGEVYRNLGKYDRAKALQESSLDKAKEIWDENHQEVAVRCSNLANVYRDLGRYEEAASLLEEALDSAEKNFGKDHPTVAVRQSNLAVVYRDLGRYEEAASLLEEALDSDLKNFGKDHPTVAVRQSNLALVYRNLGRYENATQLLEEALESDLKNFGKDHPNVARSQSNLALVYSDLGRYEKAAALLEEALDSAVKNFGKDHPAVAVSQSNLANVYRNLGRYEKAASLLEEALDSAEKNFGKDHPTVAFRLNNLAWVYHDQKQWGQALPLFEQAYGIFLQSLGEGHPHTKSVEESIAYVREQIGEQ